MKHILAILMVFSVAFPALAADQTLNTEQDRIILLAQNDEAPAADAVIEAPAEAAAAEAEEAALEVKEPEDVGEAISMGQQIAKLFKDKDYQAAVAILIMLLVWGYKKLAGMGLLKKWLPVGGKKTTMVAMGLGVLVQIAVGLGDPTSIWWISVLQGIVVGGASTGLWDLLAGQKLEATKA